MTLPSAPLVSGLIKFYTCMYTHVEYIIHEMAYIMYILGSRECLTVSCDDLSQLVKEVEAKGEELDTMETTGTSFLASAKVYMYCSWVWCVCVCG